MFLYLESCNQSLMSCMSCHHNMSCYILKLMCILLGSYVIDPNKEFLFTNKYKMFAVHLYLPPSTQYLIGPHCPHYRCKSSHVYLNIHQWKILYFLVFMISLDIFKWGEKNLNILFLFCFTYAHYFVFVE